MTIDGRKGFAEAIRKQLGAVPIQLCLFHAQAIVRRYIGMYPNHEAGQDLMYLMRQLTSINPQCFIDQFIQLEHTYYLLLHPSPGVIELNNVSV